MIIAPHICQRIQRTQKAVTWAECINDSSYVASITGCYLPATSGTPIAKTQRHTKVGILGSHAELLVNMVGPLSIIIWFPDVLEIDWPFCGTRLNCETLG